MSEIVTANLRSDLFTAYLRREITFFDQSENSVGALCTRMSEDSRTVARGGGESFSKQIQGMACLWTGIALSFASSWQIAIVVLAMLPVNVFGNVVRTMIMIGKM